MSQARRDRGPRLAEMDALQEELGQPLELVDGVVYAMGKASRRHVQLTAELLFLVQSQLRAGPCRAFAMDAAVHVGALDNESYVLPDVSIFCGELRMHPEHPDLFLGPTAVFEVLSEATHKKDLVEKMAWYQTLDTLQCYIALEQDVRRAYVTTRAADGWVTQVVTTGVVDVTGTPARLDLEALYAALDR